jgi:hypothetical protein
MTLPLISPDLNPPPLHVSKQALRLMRAAHRLLNGHLHEGGRLAMTVWHPVAWWLALHWLLRRRFPAIFTLFHVRP